MSLRVWTGHLPVLYRLYGAPVNGYHRTVDLNQDGSATPGRNEAFGNGVDGTPSMVASGLDASAAKFNDKVGQGFTPHSVLQGLPGMSGNGMDAEAAGRVMPGGYQMGSPNGSSSESYQQARMMKLMSHSDEV